MGNLFASFNTGVSGLKSAQTSLFTTAHNLANVKTEGYSRQQAIVTDYQYAATYGAYSNKAMVGLGTNVAEVRQVRNTFLDAQYRIQNGREEFYDAQYKTVTEIEDLLGEVHGEAFLNSVTDLKGAISELAKTPNDIVLRAELVSFASKFVERASVLQGQLNSYQENQNEEIQNQVDTINDIVGQIKDYNVLIRRYEATGERANDYRDSRNQLLDKLSGIVNIDTNEDIDGTISIFSEGQYLLTNITQFKLTTAYEEEQSSLLKPVWENGGDFFAKGELSYSSIDNSDVGSLKGLLVARGPRRANYTDIPQQPTEAEYTDDAGVLDKDAYNLAMFNYGKQVDEYNANVAPSTVMSVQAQLDQLVHGIVTMVNDMFCPNKTLDDGSVVLDTDVAGIGDDANQTMGTELFVRRSMERYTVTDDGSGNKVYTYNEEDPNNKYSLYTCDQLEVNPQLIQDPSKLPLNENEKSGFVDGFTLTLCQNMLDKWDDEFSTLDPNTMTAYSFQDYYGAMIGQLGTDGNVWSGIVSNQELTVKAINDERQNVMGVSSDEELSSLVQFQQCYNASSRYINVIDEMLESLITNL
ncbi:MAG: flagellar hook-associated protein FlgK [Eubacterium sp.]|nr:flagellar hook-associated protein FlgK [Eubacterium sp.]